MPLSIKRASRGFSLMELAIALGVTGLIFGAVWAAGSAVSTGSNVRVAVNDIMSIASTIRTLYSGRSASTGMTGSSADTDNTNTNDDLVKAGAIPMSLLDTTASPYTAYNNWHGKIYIKRGITKTYFRVYYTGINNLASCEQLSSAFLGGGSGVNAIYAGGSWVSVGPSSTGYSTRTSYMTPVEFFKANSPACLKESTSTYTAGVEFSLVDTTN